MKAVNFILVFLSMINNFLLFGQEIPFYCNAKIDYVTKSNLEFGKIDSIEVAYQENLLRSKNGNRFSSKIILPVVIHVLNEATDSQLNYTQAQKIINNLNNAFANIGEYFFNNGNDTNIEFCLATRDPNGNITSGVENIISESTNLISQKAFDEMVDKYHWPTTQYINIYYVNRIKKSSSLGYAVGGFATYPNAHGFIHDGIVVLKYDYENVLTNNAIVKHEMAHYLGLIHTFENGCKNDNCLVDNDKVCDTPPENIGAKLPCGAYSSCDTDDDDSSTNNPFRPIAFGGLGNQNDVNTYMDYKVCKKIFTIGQINRMHFFINGLRKSLLDSKACSSPCPNGVEAIFTLNKTSFTSGDSIIVENNSKNTIKYTWKLNGKIFSTDKIPELSNLEKGNYILKLISSSNDTLCNADSLEFNFEIICPVVAKMEFTQKDSILTFKNLSINQSSFEFKLYNGNNIIFSSSNTFDTIKITPNSYQLCLIAENNHCSDSICQSIIRLPYGSEICNNSVDDDLDGYVDFFDKDCNCIDTIFNAGCISDCNYVPDSFPDIKMKMKWMTPAINVGPFAGNILPNMVVDNIEQKVVVGCKYGFLPHFKSTIKVFDLNTGQLDRELENGPRQGHIAIFRYNDESYIISYIGSGRMELKGITGNVIWQDSFGAFNQANYSIPKIIDFNHDGIPEIYIGDVIRNALTGNILFKGISSKGCYPISSTINCAEGISSSADLIPKTGIELACGNVVYELELNNINGEIGNSFNQINAPLEVKDGFTSTADIDLDGLLDVVVVRNNVVGDGGIWIWNPRTSNLIAKANAGLRGGVAFIGNVDNDCYPEIGVTFEKELRMYKYDGSSNLLLMYSLPTTDESGRTGITMFDFNLDGKNELLYRDETHFRIIEGATGKYLYSTELGSGTSLEYPIVVNIDEDEDAEILVDGYLPSEPDSIRIFCFESAGHPWAPARKVWNQTGYHITNVNDDLTIPSQQQNNAAFFDTDSCGQNTCNQPYNSFMCQATYRDQNGCVKWPAMDMITDIIDYTCSGDSVTFRIEIRNQSTNTFRHDSVSLGLYNNSNDTPFIITQRPWEKSQDVDTIILTIPSSGINKIKARVNIPVTNSGFSANIKGLTSVLECDYENNTDSIEIDIAIKSLDLGPDITKCRTEVVTLTAPIDFVSYQWSDFSQGTTYTTADIGIHTLTAIDQCGRVYEDSIRISADADLKPFLGDIDICEQEGVTIDVVNGYDIIQWLPADKVSCDTCNTIQIISDTTFELIMITEKQGCIDADTALITIQPLIKKNIEVGICQGSNFIFYDQVLSTGGKYNHKTGQCDSLITIELTVFPPDSLMLPRQEICEGDSIFILGMWRKADLNSTIKLKNQYDCDSFITFELRVIDTLKTYESKSICEGDSIRIFDEWKNAAGSYQKSFQSSRGCDSLASVQLMVNSIYVNSESQKICQGDSIFIFNEWKKSSGIFTQKYQTINGCDSIKQVELTVEPLMVNSDSILICDGDSVVINGQSYSDEGSYQIILPSTEGCDTIYNFQLIYSPLLSKTENYSICEGDSVFINGNWLVPELVDGQAQVYVYEVTEANCKTEITANVTINYSPITNNSYLLCPDETITLNNNVISESTELTYTLQSADGCDSIIQAKVTKLTWPEPPVVELDCEGNVYNASIEADGWDLLWSDSTSSSSTTLSERPAFLKVNNDNDCERYYSLNIEDLPDLSQLPSFDNQNINEGDDINVRVELYSIEWDVKWSPSQAVSCDTCFETTISVDTNTTITLELKHLNGCTYIRTFEVIVEKEKINITIPNIINTSSSSSNNTWTVLIPDGYEVEEVKVYDRWGSIVYNNAGIGLQPIPPTSSNITWDGKLNGSYVVTGVYVYFIRLLNPEGKLEVLKGDVTVIK